MKDENEKGYYDRRNEQIDKTLEIIQQRINPSLKISYPIPSPLDANTNQFVTQHLEPTHMFDKSRSGVGLPPALWPKDKPEPLGFFGAVGREAAEMTMAGEVYDAYAKKKAFEPVDNPNLQNVDGQPIPDNWTATDNKEMIRSVPSKYRDLLMTATSPQQQQNAYNYIKEQIAKEERWNNQPYLQKWSAGLIGGAIGLGVDAFMFGWLAPFKYAKDAYQGLRFVEKAGLEAGNLMAYSFTREGLTTALDPQKNIQDLGYNALTDTAMGLMFYGGFKGLSSLFSKTKLGESVADFSSEAMSKAKDALNFNYIGIEPRYKLNAKGEVEGLTAAPSQIYAESAQKVTNAEAFYGSEIARKGLFWFPQTYRATLNPITKFATIFDNVTRGLTMEGAVPAITNTIAHHPIDTIAGKKFIPNNLSFEAEYNSIMGQVKLYQSQLEGYRLEYNGMDITKTEEEQLKQLNSKLDKNDILDSASFGKRVLNSKFTMVKDSNPQVRNAADLYTDVTTMHYKRYLASKNLSEEILPQRVYEEYFSRCWDRRSLRNNRNGFIQATVQGYRDQDELIRQYMEPINSLVEERKTVSEKINQNIDITANQNEYKRLTNELSRRKQELHQAQLDNPNLKIVLDGYTSLSSQDVKGLKKFLKPYNDIISDIQTLNKNLKSKSKELLDIDRQIKTPKKKNVDVAIHEEKVKKLNQVREGLIAEQTELKNQKEILQTNADNEMARLRGLISEETTLGENVPRNWYSLDEDNIVTFKNPDDLPKFRKLFRDENEMEESAAFSYDKIMGYNDDQLTTTSLNDFLSPSPTMARTLLVNSKYYLDGNFLNTNIPSNLENYVSSLSKSYLLDEKLQGFAGVTKKGIDGYIQLVKNYWAEKRAQAELLPQAKKEKELKRITEKEFGQEQFVTFLINGYTGVRPDKLNTGVLWVFKSSKLMAVASRLGNSALSQIGDMAAITYKSGIYGWLKGGLAPSIASLNGLIKTKQGKRLIEYAKQAGLGMEQMNKSQFIKAYEGDITDSFSTPNMVTSGLEAIAHLSQKFGLVHFMENFNQRQAASVAQGQFIKVLDKYNRGKKLTKSDTRFLETYGLNPEEWAKPVMEQYQKYGEKTFFGFQSDYFKWTDVKTQQRFSSAVFNATKDTVLSGRSTDIPVIKIPFMEMYINTNNPMANMMTQFMSYGFAAFRKYTVPFMQQLEAKQAVGLVVMAMAGILETVLRKYARGEEVDLDNDDLIREAFANSGATSQVYKTGQIVNALLKADIDFFKNDKGKNLTVTGLTLGAGAGVGQVLGNAILMGAQNAWNKQDIEKLLRASPVLNAFYLYQLNTKIIESITNGLPNTSKEALKAKE